MYQSLKHKTRYRIAFNSKIDKDGCWVWQKYIWKSGYGAIKFQGKMQRVHIISAFAFLGFDLNSKLIVRHKCDNTSCTRPSHLFISLGKEYKKL